MKLSSRKQLLSEAEQELKGIKRSINESAVPQREVEKVTQWMNSAIMSTVDDKQKEKYRGMVEDFFRYLEIERADTPAEAKKFKKNAEFSLGILDIIFSKVQSRLKELRNLESKLPEIKKIVKAVESDMKKMK